MLTEPPPVKGHSNILFSTGFKGGLQNASDFERSPTGESPMSLEGSALFGAWSLPLSYGCFWAGQLVLLSVSQKFPFLTLGNAARVL